MITSSNLEMTATVENMAAPFFPIHSAGSGAIILNESCFMKTPKVVLMLFLALPLCARAQNLAGDMALSLVLIDDQNWELVAEGYQFTDAPCADAEGNLYFTDVAKGTNIFKVGSDGHAVPFIGNAPKV